MAQSEERDRFTFFRSFYEAIRELPNKHRLAIYDAICQYGLDGTVPELTGVPKALFIAIRAKLDSSRRLANWEDQQPDRSEV